MKKPFISPLLLASTLLVALSASALDRPDSRFACTITAEHSPSAAGQLIASPVPATAAAPPGFEIDIVRGNLSSTSLPALGQGQGLISSRPGDRTAGWAGYWIVRDAAIPRVDLLWLSDPADSPAGPGFLLGHLDRFYSGRCARLPTGQASPASAWPGAADTAAFHRSGSEADWATYYNCLIVSTDTLAADGTLLQETAQLPDTARFALDTRNGVMFGALAGLLDGRSTLLRAGRPDADWALFSIADHDAEPRVGMLYLLPRQIGGQRMAFILVHRGSVHSGPCSPSGPDGLWFGR